jgi:hypothetical protein
VIAIRLAACHLLVARIRLLIGSSRAKADYWKKSQLIPSARRWSPVTTIFFDRFVIYGAELKCYWSGEIKLLAASLNFLASETGIAIASTSGLDNRSSAKTKFSGSGGTKNSSWLAVFFGKNCVEQLSC